MKAFIQKTSASVFLILGLWPLLLAFYFTVKETIIHHEMKKKLESHELQTVMVPENEVVWMEDHEIWVNNSMFDIRTKKLENGIYTFTGMYDEDETDMVMKQRKTSRSLSSEERMVQQLLHCLRQFYMEPLEEPDAEVEFFAETSSYIFLRGSQFSPPILTPPPRTGLSLVI